MSVIQVAKKPLRLTNFVRSLFYETIALQCVGLLWIIAWANALEAKVKSELEPHENQPTHWSNHCPAADVAASGIASLDDSRN